jgi:hypothetical protein
MSLEERIRLDYSDYEKLILELPNDLVLDKSELSLQSFLPRTGKQGILGIFTDKEKTKKIIFKISQYFNFTMRGEYLCMLSLKKITDFCPNFCNGFGFKQILMDSNYREEKNPFEIKNKYPIYQDVLFMESLEGCRKFVRYIMNKHVENEVVFSLIKQTLSAISIAQKNCNFTHYDLHSNNVLVSSCDPNTFILYRIDENNAYLYPTYGYYPIVIDYGFSYADEMDKQPLFQALAHTDVGFMSDRFDPMSDPRLFLTTVSWELTKYRKDGCSWRFRKLIKNIFKPIKQDWESGWDDVDDISASDHVLSHLEDTMKMSKFFRNYGYYCTDILQSLISLPLKHRKYDNIENTFEIFYSEFIKIEGEIGSDFYLLYIFKEMVVAATDVKPEYMDGDSEHAVQLFRHKMFKIFETVSKYCNPKIKYEKLLCSLLLLGKKIEGILYEVMQKRTKERNTQKQKMDIKSIDEIISLIEYNFCDQYTLNKNSKIVVIDNIQKKKYQLELTKAQLQEINEYDESLRGFMISQMLN